MLTTAIPSTVQTLLFTFNSCFTQPGFENFTALVVGWIACQGRHSISRVIQAAGDLARGKHHSALYRFLSRGSWITDPVGHAVFGLLQPFLPAVITAIVDDTLAHRGGPHIFGAGMHHDAARSTYGRGTTAGRKVFFSFGHHWVTLAIWLPLPWDARRGLALPILFRLYRSKNQSARPPRAEGRRTHPAPDLHRLRGRRRVVLQAREPGPRRLPCPQRGPRVWS